MAGRLLNNGNRCLWSAWGKQGRAGSPVIKGYKSILTLKAKPSPVPRLFLYKRRPSAPAPGPVGSDAHVHPHPFPSMLTAPDTPSQPISPGDWQAQRNSKKASLKENMEKAGEARLLGPAAAQMWQPQGQRHLREGQRRQRVFCNPGSRAGGNDGKSWMFTFIFTGIWVEDYGNRAG